MNTHRSTPAYGTINLLPEPARPTSAFQDFVANIRAQVWHGYGIPTMDATDPEPATPYPDVMIDIEALADTPDSAPAEIGIVFFDRDDATKPFQKSRYQPSPISAIQLGFNVTAGTLKWWHDKNMRIDVYQGEPLAQVLDRITNDIGLHAAKGCRVWSRGNSYDLSILKLAYQRTGKPLPWHFGNERDVRTWLEGCQFKSPRKNDHDALQDAINQALDVVEATNGIPDPAQEKLRTAENPCQPLPTLA